MSPTERCRICNGDGDMCPHCDASGDCDRTCCSPPATSSLLQALSAAESANPHAERCRVCDCIDSLAESASPEVALEVDRVVSTGTIGGETLARILAGHGYPVGRRAIYRHRREEHTRDRRPRPPG